MLYLCSTYCFRCAEMIFTEDNLCEDCTMFLGRPFIFKCDFCTTEFRVNRPGLPEGMKYVPANLINNQPLRHICASCIEQGKHGSLQLKNSGEK